MKPKRLWEGVYWVSCNCKGWTAIYLKKDGALICPTCTVDKLMQMFQLNGKLLKTESAFK